MTPTFLLASLLFSCLSPSDAAAGGAAGAGGHHHLPHLPYNSRKPLILNSFNQQFSHHIFLKQTKTERIAIGSNVKDCPPLRPSASRNAIIPAINLAKALLGFGMLSLPSAASAAGGAEYLIPLSFLTIFFGMIGAYTFTIIGKVCDDEDVLSYKQAWEKTIGKGAAFVIPSSIFFQCYLCCVSILIIIVDIISSLMKMTKLPLKIHRSAILIPLLFLVLFPLTTVQDFNAIAKFSFVGLCGSILTTFILVYRYFLPYHHLQQADVDTQSSSSNSANLANVIRFCAVLSVSYYAHCLSPEMNRDLRKNAKKEESSFASVALIGFGITSTLILIMTIFGVLCFKGNVRAMVLNNFDNSDSLAIVARIAVGISVLTSYPLNFKPMVESLEEIFIPERKYSRSNSSTTRSLNLLAIGMLNILVLAPSLLVTDLRAVTSLSGVLLSLPLMMVAPCLMRIVSLRNISNRLNTSLSSGAFVEICACYLLLTLGMLLMVIGASYTVRELNLYSRMLTLLQNIQYRLKTY